MASFDTAKEDYNKIKEFLKEVEDYPKLIIDIRGNDGGENDYWIDMVKLLADKPLSVEYYSFFLKVVIDTSMIHIEWKD